MSITDPKALIKRLEDANVRFGAESNEQRVMRRNEAIRDAIDTVRELQSILSYVLDGTQAHHLAEEIQVTVERAQEIRLLAGLDARG